MGRLRIKMWFGGCWRKKRITGPVNTDTDLAHITQESLIEGLITVQYELRMKRLGLTLGRAGDYH